MISRTAALLLICAWMFSFPGTLPDGILPSGDREAADSQYRHWRVRPLRGSAVLFYDFNKFDYIASGVTDFSGLEVCRPDTAVG